MSRFATLLVVITLTLVSSARAQTNVFGEPVPVVATSLAELQPLLEPDTVVQVMDATGMKVRGTFGRDALVLPDQPVHHKELRVDYRAAARPIP